MSSLVVSCQCGQSFAASPDLAGQTLPCPNCGRPITVAPQANASLGTTPLAASGYSPPFAAAPIAPGFSGAALSPGMGGMPAGYGMPAHGFGQQNYAAPHTADPFAMAGYSQPAYSSVPAAGALDTGGPDLGSSTMVKALIGVAVGVVVLLVGAIVGEQVFGKRDRSPTPLAAVPVSDPTKPAASVPAPVGASVPKPAPQPVPVSIPAPNLAPPPGMQAYTVPGKFTIFTPPEYNWQASAQQSLGRGVTANSYSATRPDHSAMIVSLINTPIKNQKDRRDFLRGASGGLSRGMAGAMSIV